MTKSITPEEALEAVAAQLGGGSAADAPAVSAGEMVAGNADKIDWERFYMATHRKRFLAIAEAVARYRPSDTPRMLDVGPAVQTEMLRLLYPDATIDSLGWSGEDAPARDHERHIQYDLDHASMASTWPDSDQSYDLVILAEVIEHLNVRPVTLLDLLGGFLAPGGHLIIETPNAAALPKRIRSALGRHPYGPAHNMSGEGVGLRDFHGHFREYLLEEIVAIGQAAGLECIHTEYRNDYSYQHRAGRMMERIVPFLPERLHMHIWVILRKPLSPADQPS